RSSDLAALWCFLASLEDRRYMAGVGITLGLALLTKYSAVVLVPIMLGGYGLLKPAILRTRWAAISAAALVAVLSPVIVYNVMLFSARGHFDATLWAMLGQWHPDFATDKHAFQPWSAMLDWSHWMPDGFGWPLIIIALVGFALLALRMSPSKRLEQVRHRVGRVVAFGLAAAAFMITWWAPFFNTSVWFMAVPPAFIATGFVLVVIRTAVRDRAGTARARVGPWVVLGLSAVIFIFLCLTPARKQYAGLMTIPLTLAVGYALASMSRYRTMAMVTVGAVLLLALPTANGQQHSRPFGIAGVSYLPLRPTSYAYRQLDAWLDDLYRGQPPAAQFTTDAQVTARMQAAFVARYGAVMIQRRPPMVIWDDRMDFAAVRWTLMVRNQFLFQPTLSTTQVLNVIRYHGRDYLEKLRFNDYRFIFLTPQLLQRYQLSEPVESISARMQRFLEQAGYRPEVIGYDENIQPAFVVYRTTTWSMFPEWRNDPSEGGQESGSAG
ncbi:MAG: hypothetical protein EPN26_11380, partial [Rhodospirillales bacterium]